jgi:hypothetical protein
VGDVLIFFSVYVGVIYGYLRCWGGGSVNMSYLCEDERRLPWRSYRTASFWSATRWPSLLGDPAMLSSRSVRGFPLVCGAPVDF